MKIAAVAAAIIVVAIAPGVRAQPSEAAIDALFARYGPNTPGCDIGVDRAGQPPLIRAYGSADLEHALPNTADTVFEAGSVSKQFTAASILLLAEAGKLSLDDDVRKYIPELPDYGAPITLDMLLSHTSGLRDWGDVEAFAGWPRGERVYSLRDVLAITARQEALNYAPGAAWSYTNTGYNLLAIIVQRVSGEDLPAFSHDHLFVPLGMTHTQWRDDFRRIVPGRAIAYSRTPLGYEQQMPFENVIGNTGLLTTVGDLLTWNRALAEGRLGPFVTAELQRPAKLKDRRAIEYARGLFITSYRGAPEFSHPGATAGYRAWLGRYPTTGLSVAMLCNTDDESPTLAHDVADLFLADQSPAPADAPLTRPLASWAGWYRDDRSGAALHLTLKGDVLQTDSGATLGPGPLGGMRFGQVPVTLLADGRIQMPEAGETLTYIPMSAYAPSHAELQSLVGRYHSAEANADLVITMRGDALFMATLDRPDSTKPLLPAYVGAFSWGNAVVRPSRTVAGQMTGIRLSDDRVWDLRADRTN